MKTVIDWVNSLPIRNKVLIFGVLMSTLPLLIISYSYYAYSKADLEDRIVDKQALLLENLSNEIELEINQIFQRIQVFSALSEISSKKSAFYELLRQNGSIEEAVVTNEQGEVEQRVSLYRLNLPDQREKWFTDEMWYEFQTKEKVFGEVDFNQFGQPVMKLAVPYLENGKRKGVGVIVQLQKVIGEISSLRQDHSAYLYLLDRSGRIIAHQDYSRLWQKRSFVPQKDVLGVTTNIPDLNWTMVMEQPKATAFDPINEMLRGGLLAVAVTTLTISLISIYAGLYFTKPIVLIEKAMNQLKQGFTSIPVSIKRQDELGKLANSFNDMSKELVEKSFLLEQEKERLNIVVNGIGAGLALVTKDYQITWMNPTLQEWLSEGRMEMPCYSLIGGHKAPCPNCPITNEEKLGNTDQLMKFSANDGEKIFRHRVFPLNHTIEGEGEFLIVLEDITEQKQMEEKMVQTDKLSALGVMASSFAHEVNNPLTTINVYAEDLIDRIDWKDQDLDEEEMTFYLKKIKENTERCKKITGNLLNFSRKSNWTQSEINITETIYDSISLVEHSVKKQQVQLDVQIEDGLPGLPGDSLKLMQVFVNLINNALDAVEKEGRIRIAAARDGSDIVIQVEDNGMGIQKEAIPKVFDPFYTTKPVGKGTGLGLSVCYGIIQQFGGTIHIHSMQGKGTTIELRVPAENRRREEA